MSSTTTVDRAISFLRSRIPANAFSYLEIPLRQELKQSIEGEATPDDVVDVLFSLSSLFGEPIQQEEGEALKAYLMNAALCQGQPDEALVSEIERMTVQGIKERDPVTGCPGDALVGALYLACHSVPLKGDPTARLVSITEALSEAAQDMLEYSN